MRLEPFLMERMQSTWENRVEYNLSESGVHPMTVEELLADEPGAAAMLWKQELGYPQSNGTIPLRETIASYYPGTTPDHILVTNGTSEANFVNIWRLVEPGDDVVMMLPNYMQIYGISRGFEGTIRPFHLREENGWHPDLDEFKRAVSPKTKVIAVCNPNNPTGSILTQAEMESIVETAREAGAWLLCDEVYQGAERELPLTPSFWGMYDRVIVTNGLSKAFGLPGLRIGWIVAPPEHIAALWMHHDYLTIGAGMLSNHLAQIALSSGTRQRIRIRTQGILQANYPILAGWIREHAQMFSITEPQAGAIAYLRYNMDINSTTLVEKLLHEKSVLIVPGDHFGMDRYLRIGYGPPAEYLKAALDRIHATLVEL